MLRRNGVKAAIVSMAAATMLLIGFAQFPARGQGNGNGRGNQDDREEVAIGLAIAPVTLDFDKKGREHHFRPLVNSADYTHAASRSFLSRFFDGEVAPFLACFLEREKLSRQEIEELRRILDDKQK